VNHGHAYPIAPEIVGTSWFGAQRWMHLDTSWDFLFAG
jgi:hypothetical protein